MTKRQEQAALTRQKLLDAAMTLLSRKSADLIRIDEITELAGVAKGTFYVYFQSKEEVVRELEISAMNQLLDYSVKKETEIAAQLLLYMRLYLKLVMDLTLELYKNVLKIEIEQKGNKTVTLDSINRTSISSILLQAGYPQNAETELTVNALTAFLHGAALEWAFSGGKTNPDTIVTGCGPRLIQSLLTDLNKKEKKE